MFMRRSWVFGLTIFVLFAGANGAGCGRATGPLEETHWKLVSWTTDSMLGELVPSTPETSGITATFARDEISGSVGINTYKGSCNLGPSDVFNADPALTTYDTSSEDGTLAEALYLGLLHKAKSYAATGDKLTLLDENGVALLVFEKAGE